jgi:hypothetical protein
MAQYDIDLSCNLTPTPAWRSTFVKLRRAVNSLGAVLNPLSSVNGLTESQFGEPGAPLHLVPCRRRGCAKNSW